MTENSKDVGLLLHLAYLLLTNIFLPYNNYSLMYPYLTYCNMIWSSNHTPKLTTVLYYKMNCWHYDASSLDNSHTSQAFAQLNTLNFPHITNPKINAYR